MAIAAPKRANVYTDTADFLIALPKVTAQVRAETGITAKLQADEIGITPSTLARYEAGSNPSLSTVMSILEWLGDLRG